MLKKSLPWAAALAVIHVSGAAFAADAPVARDWTGFYAGLHVGVTTGVESSLKTTAGYEEDVPERGAFCANEPNEPNPSLENCDPYDNVWVPGTGSPVEDGNCDLPGNANDFVGTLAECEAAFALTPGQQPVKWSAVGDGQGNNGINGTCYANGQVVGTAGAADEQQCKTESGIYEVSSYVEPAAATFLTDALSNVSSEDSSNFAAGINAGYNMQHGALVFGVEGDLSFLADGEQDISSSTTFSTLGGDSITSAASGEFGVGAMGTLRARLGYDMGGNWMPFVTGGLAWGRVSTEGTATYSVDDDDDGAIDHSETSSFGDKSWELGWTVGAGLNYRVGDHAVLGLTYLYTDLGEHGFSDEFSRVDGGDENVTFVGGVEGEVDASFHTVRFSFDVMF